MFPKKISIDSKIPIYIFWHIYANKNLQERAKNIIERQFEKIKKSGLLDRCEQIFIGYVGDVDFPSEEILKNSKVRFFAREFTGGEGITTLFLKLFCDYLSSDALVLHIHNRGVTHNPDFPDKCVNVERLKHCCLPAEDWTLMMEFFTIERWAQSIAFLEDKFACGCEMWSHAHREFPNDFIFHYVGNFWWARSDYIKLLDFPSFFNRYTQSEDWILQKADHGIDKEHFAILHRTSAKRHERGMVHGYIDRYPPIYYKSGRETPDLEIDRTKFHGEGCSPV